MRHLSGALTLAERMSSLGKALVSRSEAPGDHSIALDAISRWKSQKHFAQASTFQKRLQADRLSEEELLEILSRPPELYAELLANQHQWSQDLERLYFGENVGEDDGEFQQWAQGTNGFLWVASPLIQEARRRLQQAIERLFPSNAPIEPSRLDSLLLPNLFNALKPVLDGVMALELNIARIKGLLNGEGPEERFRSFCDNLRQPEVRRSLLLEYPVLFRQLCLKISSWVDSGNELLSRLAQDWSLIREKLVPSGEPGEVIGISMGQGDDHRRGRSVTILEFSSGLKIVYKPRSLSLDVHFGEFLEWVNQAGFEPPLYIPKVIDRGSHGWSEFVEYRSCSHFDEVQRYYQRLGGYLAIFYALRTTDMHRENMIACGEFPVPVDLETLLHQDVEDQEDPAVEAFQSSVMRVLLLPTWIGPEIGEPVDISASGAKDGQYLPAGSVGTWEGQETDEMRRVFDKPVPMKASRNQPKLADQAVLMEDSLRFFEKGFEQAYRLLESRRGELAVSGGMLDRFGEDEVRFVARPTRLYGAMLEKSLHPDMLRNAVDREQLFDGLWQNAAGFALYPRLIRAEREDLQNGDVPVFTSRPNSRDLWSSRGERIPEAFEQSTLARVRKGLYRLGDEDLNRQTSFLRASIIAAGERVPVATKLERFSVLGSRDAMDLARAIGDSLCHQALEYENNANWIGLKLVGAREAAWSLEPLTLDFYAGLSGVSFFLAYLGALTGDNSYSKLARKAINLVRRRLEDRRAADLPIAALGAFSSGGGTIYALTHLGVLWRDNALLSEANLLASDLAPHIETDGMLDVMNGCAGLIAVLEALNTVTPNDRLREISARCGERLSKQAQPQAKGSGWKTELSSSQPLTGFSHGAAGIAWALLKLTAWTGDEGFRVVAESAIAYERSTFASEEGNWPDYRSGMEKSPFMIGWCHGAAGIGLARVDSLKYMDDRETREEIRIALTKTLESRFGTDHCLCHGDLGKLDILLCAQPVDGVWWKNYGNCLLTGTLAEIAEHGPICGVRTSLASYGMMTGIAGIGYALLRMSSPKIVPSVLTLAPPSQELSSAPQSLY